MPIDPNEVQWDEPQGINPSEVQWDSAPAEAPKPNRKDSIMSLLSPKSVASNSLIKGAAGAVDFFGNAIPNAVNLAAIPIHAAATGIGITDKPYSPPMKTNNTARAMESIGLINPEMNPQTSGQRVVDTAIQGGMQTALTGKPSASMFGLGALSAGIGKKVEEDTGSEMAGTAANLLASAAIPYSINAAKSYGVERLAKQQAKLDLEKQQNKVIDKTIKDFQEAGYVTPPAMLPKNESGIMSDIGGKVGVESAASVKNQQVTNSLARKDMGLPENAPLTRETLKAARNKAGEVYAKLKKQPPIKIDAEYKPSDLSPKIDKSVGLDMQQKYEINMGDAVDHIRQLRKDAKSLFLKVDDPASQALARKTQGEADSLEGLIERNLKANGNKSLLRQFRDARKSIAKSHMYEGAIVEGSGNVDAVKLASQVKNMKDVDLGEARKIVNFANNFGKAAKSPAKMASRNAGKLSVMLGSAGRGAVGSVVGAGINKFAPEAVQNYLLSPQYQAKLMPDYIAKQNALSNLRGVTPEEMARIAAMSGNALSSQ